jgi:thiol-disulfide isomerase/thioredoxin
MKSNKVLIINSLVIGWLMLGLPFFVDAQTDSAALVKVGQQVPAFTIANSTKSVDMAQLKGKVVWINFFATWCGPCRDELPELQKVYQRLQANPKFELLVIGRQHTQAEIDAFAKSTGLVLPFYPDPTRAVFNLFATSQIPRNIIIDAKGNIIFSESGYEPESFQKLVELVDKELVK